MGVPAESSGNVVPTDVSMSSDDILEFRSTDV